MQREDGAALVEFSLVLSLLVLITFGIIGFGRASLSGSPNPPDTR